MSTQELEIYIRTHAGVKSVKQMAAETYCDKGRIAQLARVRGICIRNIEQMARRADLERLIRLHHKDKTVKEVALLAGQPLQTAATTGRRMGIKFKLTKFYKPEKEKIVEEEWKPIELDGPFFNEHQMDNWLIH